MIIDFLDEAMALLRQQNTPEPYEITMPEGLWQKLRAELINSQPFNMRLRRRFMGEVMGFKVYVDDDAPPGQIIVEGKR